MSATNALHIAVLAGDGIGPEVMAHRAGNPAQARHRNRDCSFASPTQPAGANHYRETGTSMPESTVRLCDEADAILLGASGLPSVRYPDDAEIMSAGRAALPLRPLCRRAPGAADPRRAQPDRRRGPRAAST